MHVDLLFDCGPARFITFLQRNVNAAYFPIQKKLKNEQLGQILSHQAERCWNAIYYSSCIVCIDYKNGIVKETDMSLAVSQSSVFLQAVQLQTFSPCLCWRAENIRHNLLTY